LTSTDLFPSSSRVGFDFWLRYAGSCLGLPGWCRKNDDEGCSPVPFRPSCSAKSTGGFFLPEPLFPLWIRLLSGQGSCILVNRLRSDVTAMQSRLLLESTTMIIALSRHLTVADTPNVSNTNGPVSQLAQRIKGSAHDRWAWAGRWRPCDNWKNSKKQLIGLVRCKDRERSQAIFLFPPPRSAAA
jgi:hypothetical protein